MDEVKYIATSLLDAPGQDARVGVDEAALKDLELSVRQNGILQPLLVRPRADRYEVIAGGRRLRAARKLSLPTVPCLVRNAGDSETAIFRMEENLKRVDVSPVEEAKYIAEAITALGVTVADFAQKIGRSAAWIEDRLEVAGMPDYLQGYLHQKTISLGVALALNEIEDETVRKDWSYHAATSGMTVLSAQNALREWQKLHRMQQDDPEAAAAQSISLTPPVAYADCVRCGSRRPIVQFKFVRICNPVCPTEESAP